VNQLVLQARVAERAAMRYTPAGLPALDLSLAHESVVQQEGQPRKVSLEIAALAVGSIADRLATVPVGAQGVFCGFIGARRNGRGVLFHVMSFDPGGPTG
jgi:primosomal replication protein N